MADTGDVNALSDAEAKELADSLSTDEDAVRGENFGFADDAFANGKNNIEEYFDKPEAVVITNPLLAEGGWKGYIRSKPDPAYPDDPDTLNYINFNIQSNGDNVKAKVHWGTFVVDDNPPHESKEDYSSEGTGRWNSDYTGLTASVDGTFEIEKFIYIDGDKGKEEYAYGTFQWISGEEGYVVLCRPGDANMGGNASGSGSKSSRGSSGGSDKSDSSGSSGSKKSDESSGGGKLSNADIVEKARKKAGAPNAELDSVDPN